MDQVVLASRSPRRQALLKQMGIPFLVHSEEVDETWNGSDSFEEFACALARKKVEAVLSKNEWVRYRWFIGADTLVVADNQVLAKPRNREEAQQFLHLLSGRIHSVITGACLFDRKQGCFDTVYDKAWVRFAPLSEAEIERYLDTQEWEGVAGGYRIQERAACFIESIQGNYSTVMGLPIRSIYVILMRNGYPFWDT
ncbi:MAG: Maf family protein [Spirochaetales bacterium]